MKNKSSQVAAFLIKKKTFIQKTIWRCLQSALNINNTIQYSLSWRTYQKTVNCKRFRLSRPDIKNQKILYYLEKSLEQVYFIAFWSTLLGKVRNPISINYSQWLWAPAEKQPPISYSKNSEHFVNEVCTFLQPYFYKLTNHDEHFRKAILVTKKYEYCASNDYTIHAIIYTMHHLCTNVVAPTLIMPFGVNQRITRPAYSLWKKKHVC